MSVILVEPQFLARFTRIQDGASGAGFWKGLLTAMIELGALLGALNQGWIADKFSRKYSIVIAVCVFTLGSAIQTGAVNYAMLVVARFIGGLGIGMLSMVAPLYISEISPPEIRGTLLVLEEFSIVTGIVVAFWITYGTQYIPSEWAWRLPFLLQIIPGLVLGGGITFLPFSPRWLSSKGRDKEALHSLSKLRQLPETDRRVQLEWFDIRAEVTLHKEISAERHPRLQDGSVSSRLQLEIASWLDCFRRGCWRRTHVGLGIMFFQQVRSHQVMLRKWMLMHTVRRYQCAHLLFTDTIRNDGTRPLDAAHHVRHPQRHTTRRRYILDLEHGPLRPTSPPPHWQRAHVPLTHHHRDLGGQVWQRLACTPRRGLGQRGILAVLHGLIRRKLGSCPVGCAVRNLPIFAESKGRGAFDMFELVQVSTESTSMSDGLLG